MREPLRFRVAFSTPWFQIEEGTAPGSPEAPYYRMTGPDGIICLPLTTSGKIIAIRQFRPSLGRETLEIPAGSIDPDESPMIAARRELFEETGYHCETMVPLGTGRLYLNRCTQREHFFLGLEAIAVSGSRPEPGIVPDLISRQTFHRMVQRDEIEQAAILSLIGMTSARFGVDLLRDPIAKIRRVVLAGMAKE